MKALTLHQPWASLVALDVKTIETRSWATKYRGPLAIHAAKKVEYGQVGEFYAEPLFKNVRHVDDCYCDSAEIDVPCQRWAKRTPCLTRPGREPIELPVGAVVATCTLIDVVPITDDGMDALEVYPRLESSLGGGDFPDGWLDLWHPTLGSASEPEGSGRSIPDQAPYGDYSPGRFAWLLTDITPIDPVPAKGKQGLWEWMP